MLRTIVGFHQDREGHWVAHFDCLHRQHVRHQPPLQDRTWVLDAGGRQARIGTAAECGLCDRPELPAQVTLVRVTREFTEDSIPAGLRAAHRVAEGVWGVIEVRAGALRYRQEGGNELRLLPGDRRPIPPGVPHEVEPEDEVRFAVEFWGPPAEPGPPKA